MRRSIIYKHNRYKGLPCIKAQFYIPKAATRDVFCGSYKYVDYIEEIFVNYEPVKSTDRLSGGFAFAFPRIGYYTVEYYFKKNITNLSNLFKEVNALKSVVFYDWKNTQVTNISNMFYLNKGIEKIDFNNFNFKKITDAQGLVSVYNQTDKTYLTSSLKTVKFNLKSITENFKYPMNMFSGCTELQTVDITNFDLKKGLYALTNDGVNQFVNRMFDMCTSLRDVYIYSSGVIEGTRVTDNMFLSTTPGKLYCIIKTEADKENYKVFQNAADGGLLGGWEIVYITK